MEISFKIPSFRTLHLWFVGIFLGILINNCTRPLHFSEGTTCKQRIDVITKEFNLERYVDVREPLNEYIITCGTEDKLDYAYYLLAESYFLLEDWSLAELEYQALLHTFSTSKYREEVFFKMANSIFKQRLSWDRDQEKLYLALKFYQDFLLEYPISNYALEVRKNSSAIRKELAKRELKTARMYQHLGASLSAIVYYKSYLEEFIDLAEEAKIYYNISQCYFAAGQFIQAEEYLSLAESKGLEESVIKSLRNDIFKQQEEKKEEATQKKYFENL